jgi:Ni/Co efflux regulator RcnB
MPGFSTVTIAFRLSSDAMGEAWRRPRARQVRKIGEMKRLIPIFAAVVALAGPLAVGSAAAAKDHGQGQGQDRGGRGASERGYDHGNRGNGRGGEYRGEPRGPERRVYEAPAPYRGGRGGRGDPRGADRRVYEEPGPYRGRGDPDRGDRRVYEGDRRAYESEGPAPYYAPSPRRGGYMPPPAGGAIQDYGRYRLRPPPRGFVWLRTNRGYAMVEEETGRVFDIVPY